MTTTSAGTDSVEVDSEADWWGIVIDEFGLATAISRPRSAPASGAWCGASHEAWDARTGAS